MRRARAYIVAFSVACCAAFSAATPALSQSIDPATATELFRQGREAMTRDDYKTACAKFAESLRLDAKVGTLLNLAECEEKLGVLASARQHLQRAIDLALVENDDRLALARERFAALDKRVPRLTVTVAEGAPASVQVKRDDVLLGSASLGTPLPVETGAHVIVVTAPGYEGRSYDVDIKEAETRSIAVEVGAKVIVAAAPAEPSPPPGIADRARVPASSSTKTWGFVAGGLGLVGVGVGTVLGLMAISKNSKSKQSCDANNVCEASGKIARDDARVDGNLSTIAFVVGGVALAAGVTLVILAPKDARSGNVRIDAAPTVGPGNAGLLLRAQW